MKWWWWVAVISSSLNLLVESSMRSHSTDIMACLSGRNTSGSSHTSLLWWKVSIGIMINCPFGMFVLPAITDCEHFLGNLNVANQIHCVTQSFDTVQCMIIISIIMISGDVHASKICPFFVQRHVIHLGATGYIRRASQMTMWRYGTSWAAATIEAFWQERRRKNLTRAGGVGNSSSQDSSSSTGPGNDRACPVLQGVWPARRNRWLDWMR